jgi:hypothetical protein
VHRTGARGRVMVNWDPHFISPAWSHPKRRERLISGHSSRVLLDTPILAGNCRRMISGYKTVNSSKSKYRRG